MVRAALKKVFAYTLLLILISAYVGQEVHIYNEDLSRFAGFSGDLVPDNGAKSEVVSLCKVCNYWFFPYLTDTPHTHDFYVADVVRLQPALTCCKLSQRVRFASLRAPPVV